MKLLLTIFTIMFVVATASADNLTGAYKTITMDGSSADWTGADIMYPDSQITDGLPLTSTYSEVSVCNNGTDMYVGLATKGTGGGSIMNGYTRELYIDNDMDSTTGFNAGWMSAGYDRLVQYGIGGTAYSIFEFNGANQSDWSWNFLVTINYSYSDNFIEWSIPLNQINLSNNQAKLEFHVTGGNVSPETWAYEWESSVGTYTRGIPEPTFIGLGILGILALIRRK